MLNILTEDLRVCTLKVCAKMFPKLLIQVRDFALSIREFLGDEQILVPLPSTYHQNMHHVTFFLFPIIQTDLKCLMTLKC